MFEWISGKDLVEALRLNDLSTSGAKIERVERLVRRMVPAQLVLQSVSIADLQAIAEQVGCVKYGSKDQLIARLGNTLRTGTTAKAGRGSPTPVAETKALSQAQFAQLFESLSGRESDHPRRAADDLPRSGSKSFRVATLWGSTYSEVTLLCSIQNRQLEDALARLDLRTRGTKTDRVNRLVDYALAFTLSGEEEESVPTTSELQAVPEFVRGRAYTRKEVISLLGVPDANGGPWYTGYARHGTDWFIFANVSTPGRTGHDYANKLVSGKLEWYGREESRLANASIQSMVNPGTRVHIFIRSDDREPFKFFGYGSADRIEDTSPVRIVWKLQ